MLRRIAGANVKTSRGKTALWNFLATDPIQNNITVYSTIMIPALNMYGSGVRIGDHDPSEISGWLLADESDEDAALEAVVPT